MGLLIMKDIFVVIVFSIAIVLGNPEELPKDLRDPVLFCEGCYGTMYEIHALMTNTKHERMDQRIANTLDQVCSTDLLRKYVFSPPKMSKVCKAMVKHFEKD